MSLTCKNCGGNIVFDKEKLRYVCDSCGRIQSDANVGGNIICDGENTTVESVEKYKRALRIMDTAVSENMFTMAAMLFDEAHGFSDSAERANECRGRALELRQKRLYTTALQDMCATDPEKISKARETLLSLGDYEQARENAEKCLELYKTAVKNQPQPEKVIPQKQKKKKRFPILIIIAVIVIALIVGNNLRENAAYSADNISIEFTPHKSSYFTEYSNRYVFSFSVLLKNDGEKDVEAIDGIVTFVDRNGNVLVDTEASFSGTPIAVRHGRSSKYTWELTVYSLDTARELYNIDFDDYDIEFQIKTIRFSDGEIVEYD